MTVIARGPAQLYDVRGSADVPYRVVLAYDNTVESTCTCPAFFYRQKREFGNECKHLDRVRAQVASKQEDTLLYGGSEGFLRGELKGALETIEDLREGRQAAPGGVVELLEDAFTRGMELGRKFGALYGKAAR